MVHKILVVEDEPDFQAALTEILTIQGYEVIALSNCAEFKDYVAQGSFDLAILDRTLPDGDGICILEKIRETASTPVIMLTGVSQFSERIRGMDADADHYLIKPVNIKELLAIIRRLFRRNTQPTEPAVDAWRLDAHSWTLLSPAGVEVILTHRESEVLKCFAGFVGEVVHRDLIVKGLGFDPMVYDMRRLETMVSRLRKKLELSGIEDFPLQTVYGTGYALHAELRLT